MEPETAVSGGWQAAIDPSLAARLLRPAVRPGVSDPHHGRTLAARLQRMAAPTLSDDVARRYGSTALDAGRPPVVYAAPPIQTASMDPQRTTAGPSGSLRKGSDAGRPVVQASARTTGPVFPPLRPSGAGAVQRMADPAAVRRVSDTAPRVQRMNDPEAVQRMSASAAVQRMVDAGAVQRMANSAAMPVALARRIGIGTAGGASTGPRGAERSVPDRPVVAPAPTRLQRQIAAEHADAVPIAARVHATRTLGGGGVSTDAPPSAERAAGPGSHGPIAAAAAIVQRRIDPGAAHPSPVAERPMEGTLPAAPLVVLAAPGGGEGAGAGTSAGPAALPLAMPAGTGGSGGTDGGPIQAIRAHPAKPWSPPDGGGGGGPSGARPVVVARNGGVSRSGGAAVQRMAMGAGAGAGLDGAAPRMVHAAPAVVVQRRDATTKPPAGGPLAELPTMTAGDAPGTRAAGGSDAAALAEQVYGLLLRRLQNERKQRGW